MKNEWANKIQKGIKKFLSVCDQKHKVSKYLLHMLIECQSFWNSSSLWNFFLHLLRIHLKNSFEFPSMLVLFFKEESNYPRGITLRVSKRHQSEIQFKNSREKRTQKTPIDVIYNLNMNIHFISFSLYLITILLYGS